MFGHCVWLKLNSNHIINNVISNFYSLFNTQKYLAHLTIDYNINPKNYNKDNYIIDNLIIKGDIYITEIKNFYSIQQDYYFKNNSNNVLHFSLAYKLNNTFTEQELSYIKSVKLPQEIKKEDLEINLWNCNSKKTTDWKFIA